MNLQYSMDFVIAGQEKALPTRYHPKTSQVAPIFATMLSKAWRTEIRFPWLPCFNKILRTYIFCLYSINSSLVRDMP